jgi:hypothetical protein
MSYATMPVIACRLIAVVATMLAIFFVLVGLHVVATRLREHLHHDWGSFLVAIGILCFVVWRAMRVAMNAGRHGWPRA